MAREGFAAKFDTCRPRGTLCLNARERPACEHRIRPSRFHHFRPAYEYGHCGMRPEQGRAGPRTAFLAGYLSSGDEIQVPLGSNQVGTEIHVRKNAASRFIRELYEAPIGYVTRPKEDKRKDLFVTAGV